MKRNPIRPNPDVQDYPGDGYLIIPLILADVGIIRFCAKPIRERCRGIESFIEISTHN
jgi:hypothetical protein